MYMNLLLNLEIYDVLIDGYIIPFYEQMYLEEEEEEDEDEAEEVEIVEMKEKINRKDSKNKSNTSLQTAQSTSPANIFDI